MTQQPARKEAQDGHDERQMHRWMGGGRWKGQAEEEGLKWGREEEIIGPYECGVNVLGR